MLHISENTLLKEHGYMTGNTLPGRLVSVYGSSQLTIRDAPPCTLQKLSVYGSTADSKGVGDHDEETGLYKIPIMLSGINHFNGEGFAQKCLELSTAAYLSTISGDPHICVPLRAMADGYTGTNFSSCFTAVRPLTQYTFFMPIMTLDASATNNLYIAFVYDDGTSKKQQHGFGYSESIASVVSDPVKTTTGIAFSYGHGSTCALNHYKAIIYEGVFTEATAPPFEPYFAPEALCIYSPSPLFDDDHIKVNFKTGKALLYRHGHPTEDISDLQSDLHKLCLHKGTDIINIDTGIVPSCISICY